jgi:hypothetical protein
MVTNGIRMVGVPSEIEIAGTIYIAARTYLIFIINLLENKDWPFLRIVLRDSWV